MPASIGIVIVNWNGKKLTRKCIESIEERTEFRDYEIIVFDNNSSDGSQEMIREEFPDVRLIEHDCNIGFVGGENEGVLRTNHDYYFLANNDIIVHTEGWLEKLVEVMESEEEIGIVGPDNDPSPVYHGGAYFSPVSEGSTVEYEEGETVGTREVDVVSGAQYLIAGDVFDRVGLIDEIYWPAYNEELDFCHRAGEAGFKVMFEPDVLVEHLEGRTVDEDLDKFEIGRKHAIRYRWLNYSPTWLALSLLAEPRYMAGCVLSSMIPLRTREDALERLKRQIKAYWWNIKHLPDILEGRRVRKEVLRTGNPHMEYWTKHRQAK